MRCASARLSWLLAALALAGCPSSNGKPKSAGGDDKGERIILFATTEVKGQVEPCGCNSDPMGDLARIVKVVQGARAGGQPVVVVDAGSLLYPHDMTGKLAPEDQQHLLRAELLAKVYGEQLKAEVGLGPFDFGKQPAVAPPRQAANVPAGGPVAMAEPRVVQAGKVKLGIFGVSAPSAVKGATDPAAAARTAIERLRKEGAQVVVGLAHMQKKDARDLARKVPGIDFLIVGQNAPAEPARVSDVPDQVGSTWLVQPANRGQVVSRIEIAVRGAGGPFADAVGPARVPILEAKLADARAELARFEKDPAADKGFVAAKRSEVAELDKDLAGLRGSPLRIPDQGSWFTLEQVRIRRKLACDPATQSRKQELDKAIGQANLAEAKKKGPPPRPPKGTAAYVGMEECTFCHKEATAFWKTTVHAKAWETLTALGKDADYDCVKCHLTGWDQPGGSNLAFNESLRDVQCEVCHGPGSLHVAADGKEKKPTLVRAPPEDVCLRCHTKEHSDTFDYQPYLRDVTGKGHGEAFRARLGEGPVAHTLRAAALEKAGREVGAGCQK